MGEENSLYAHLFYERWEELKATLWKGSVLVWLGFCFFFFFVCLSVFNNDMEVPHEERTGVLFAKFLSLGLGR